MPAIPVNIPLIIINDISGITITLRNRLITGICPDIIRITGSVTIVTHMPVITESAILNKINWKNPAFFLSGRLIYIRIVLSSDSMGLIYIIPATARNDNQKAEFIRLYGLIHRRITLAIPNVLAISLVLPSTSASIYTRIIITARLADAL